MKKSKSLTQKLKEAKEEIAFLKKENQEIIADRERFRVHFANNMKRWIRLLGSNQVPCMKDLVEQESKFLQKVKLWYW